MNWLIDFYTSLAWPIKIPLDFSINIVLMRIILPEKIKQEITQLGWLNFSIIGYIMKHLEGWTTIARKVAIIEHYTHKHVHDDVLGCTEEKCVVFTNTEQIAPTRAVTA